MPLPSEWAWRRRNYYSTSAAVEADYEELAKKDPILKAALLQIELAEAAIEGRMQQLADEEADD